MIKVVTCNLRGCRIDDGDNSWRYRRNLCLEVMRNAEADLIGCQEVQAVQIDHLRQGLPEYCWYGLMDNANGCDPMNSLFWRKDRFDVITMGGYWLSKQPHVPGSKSWDSRHIRLANWVRLQDKQNGKELRLINTHLDNIGHEARVEQARLIDEDAKAYPETLAQLLTGDFNSDASHPAIKLLTKNGWQDTYQAVHGLSNPGFSFHAFKGHEYNFENDSSNQVAGKMDWIFMRGGLTVKDSTIIKDHHQGRYPSDHFFVSANLDWAQE